MYRLLALTIVVVGCERGGDQGARFVPAPAVARAAVTAALDAWKQGKRTRVIEGTTPPVHIVDEMRTPGQRLVDFKLLGEVPGAGPRTFTAALELENPKAALTARYVVVGIDPLWVFRQEDFDKMAHWEMNMHHDDDPKPEAQK